MPCASGAAKSINNMTTLAYTKDLNYHWRTKHIDIRYRYVRDVIAQGEMLLEHNSTI